MRTIDTLYREIESVPDFAGHKINSVNYTNGYKDTPLHIVSNWGDCESIEMLVLAGANLNAKGEPGFTPLHCAVEQNKPDAIVMLRRLGAKILKDDDDSTPLDLANILNCAEAVNALTKNV